MVACIDIVTFYTTCSSPESKGFISLVNDHVFCFQTCVKVVYNEVVTGVKVGYNEVVTCVEVGYNEVVEDKIMNATSKIYLRN